MTSTSADGERVWPETPAGLTETLEEGLSCLGRPPFLTEAEARAALDPHGTLTTWPLCSAEAARTALHDAAIALLEDLRDQAAAPRLRQVADRLIEIEKLAATLFFRLRDLDDYTHSMIDIRLHNANGLLIHDLEDRTAKHPLETLSHAAALARQDLRDDLGDDVGGRGNIVTLRYGPAKRRLARECADIFLAFNRAEDLSGTVGGRFFRLVASIWQYATGDDPETAGLEPIIKTVAPAMKELQRVAEELDSLFDTWTAEAMASRAALTKRRDELWSQIGLGTPRLVSTR